MKYRYIGDNENLMWWTGNDEVNLVKNVLYDLPSKWIECLIDKEKLFISIEDERDEKLEELGL